MNSLSAVLLLLSVSLVGCGPAAIAKGVSSLGGGSDGNAPPTISILDVPGFGIEQPKESPAKIRFLVVDSEGDDVTVEFFVAAPGQEAEASLVGLDKNPITLEGSGEGVQHELPWRFTEEPKIPSDGRFIAGVKLIARLSGGNQAELVVDLGNDAPVAAAAKPKGEVSGIALVGFRLSDTSSDVAKIKVEYQVQDGLNGQWRLARPSGLAPQVRTPEYALERIVAPAGGIDRQFFWDTAADLAGLERDVKLRFTPEDSVMAGEPSETAVFRVDNNAEPIAQFGALFANSDVERGIPIPYSVIDEEGDPVRVIFQWRKATDPDFPDLSTTDPAEFAQLLRDPEYRRIKKICRPFSSFVGGRAQPVGGAQIRLPELVPRESSALVNGVESRDLELLRPSCVPGSLAGSWASRSPLTSPRAAVPLGNGLTALVIDGAGGSARILEIALATGEVVRTFAPGIGGTPTALALRADESGALVATDVGGVWRLHHVDLTSGVVSSIAAAPASPRGPIRGVLPLAGDVVLLTAEDGLWRCDFSDRVVVKVSPVVRGLRTPWGIALDPTRPGAVWLAERDAPVSGGTGRIVQVDLATRTIGPAVGRAPTSGRPAFPRVTAIAPRGLHGLVAVCQPATTGDRELVAISLGVADNEVFSVGRVSPDAASVASGSAGLLLVALPGAADLAAGGGIEQSRRLISFDPAAATATVAVGFAPEVWPGQPWRISARDPFWNPIHGSLGGTRGMFVWDSREVGLGDPVHLKVTCMDREFGTSGPTTISRRVTGLDYSDTENLPAASLMVPADIDGDGDLDLVALGGSDDVFVIYQRSPRDFESSDGISVRGSSPVAMAVADINRDGILDIVTANRDSDNLTVLLQNASGKFDARPRISTGGKEPVSVVAADFDGDGRVDLAATNFDSNDVVILYQDASGNFGAGSRLPTRGSHPVSIVASDLDGDGDVDLAVANRDSHDVTIVYQEGVRRFVAQDPLRTGGRDTVCVRVADLDGDGDEDLVSGNAGTEDLTVFFQDSPRNFVAQRVLPTGSSGLLGVEVADLDGDHRLDLIAGNGSNRDLSVFLHRTPREFVAQGPIRRGGFGTLPLVSLAVADINGDGATDIVNVHSGYPSGVSYQGAPRGFVMDRFTTAPPTVLDIADMDGDGNLDLLTGYGDAVAIVFQEAPRSFSARQIISTGRLAGSVAADLDGDGDQDIVVMTDSLSVLHQESGGKFRSQLIAAGVEPIAVAVSDLDGDADLDLVYVRSRRGDLTILYQDAAGAFVRGPVIAVGGFDLRSLVAADLDGDGRPDLAVTDGGKDELVLYFQVNAGVYVAAPRIATGGQKPTSLAVSDLDCDGDLDVVVGHEFEFAIVLQISSRRFVARAPITGESITVRVADFDGDGDPDVAASGRELTVFYQEKPLEFRPGETLQISPFPTGFFAPDLDADGDHDFVFGDSLDVSVRVGFGRR